MAMSASTPPRLYVIPAAAADVALIFRRGPSSWWHLVKWNFSTEVFEYGAWLRHSFYPRRCDVSPDGCWLVYFGVKRSIPYRSAYQTKLSREAWPQAFTGIARTPWVHALAAWFEIGTYSNGFHFCEGSFASAGGPPFVGVEGLHHMPFALAPNDNAPFAVERQRGWIASPSSPASISKPCPMNPDLVLECRLSALDFTRSAIEGHQCVYRLLREDGQAVVRSDLAWADWTRDGRLIAATNRGTLILETIEHAGQPNRVKEFTDLLDLQPNPQPAPAWATRWK